MVAPGVQPPLSLYTTPATSPKCVADRASRAWAAEETWLFRFRFE